MSDLPAKPADSPIRAASVAEPIWAVSGRTPGKTAKNLSGKFSGRPCRRTRPFRIYRETEDRFRLVPALATSRSPTPSRSGTLPMFPLSASQQPTRVPGRRARARQAALAVEQLDKRQVFSAAPTVDVPAFFDVQEQQTTRLDFGVQPFTDVDSPGSKRMTVTVNASAGTLIASSGSGVRVSGKGSNRVFTGSLDNLNAYFSGSGQVDYRSTSAGAYSLSVKIAEKAGRRTLSSTDWATLSVTQPIPMNSSTWSSSVSYPPQPGSASSASSSYSYADSSYSPSDTWSSFYPSYSPSYSSSYSSYDPSSSWYSSYGGSYYYYPSYSSPYSYSYPSYSSSYASSYPNSSWSSSYGSSYAGTTSSTTQSLLDLQSSYFELQRLNNELIAMGQQPVSVPSSVTDLLYGGNSYGGNSYGGNSFSSPSSVSSSNSYVPGNYYSLDGTAFYYAGTNSAGSPIMYAAWIQPNGSKFYITSTEVVQTHDAGGVRLR